MSQTTVLALPPLEPLFRLSAKRTRDIFAAYQDDVKEEEGKRYGID